jgi:hypothetical protein
MAGKRCTARDVLDFVEKLTGARSRTCTLYGLQLRKHTGEVAVYIGREGGHGGRRPDKYIGALASPSVGGRCSKADEHLDWQHVPGRLQDLWKQGFHCDGTIVVLKEALPSMETAAAFAAEKLLQPGKVIGGLLALDTSADVVHDACKLQRLHDDLLCVRCGRGGHFASEDHLCPEKSLTCEQLPFRVQGLKKRADLTAQKLAVAEQQRADALAALAAAEQAPRAPHVDSVPGQLKRIADGVERLDAGKRSRAAARENPAHGSEAVRRSVPSEADWESDAGPRLPADALRERFSLYRVQEKFRAAVEEDLGGVCVDLAAFAKSEVATDRVRKKTLMKGAKKELKEPALRQRFAYLWVKDVYRKHVANALQEGRLLRQEADYHKKMKVRGGGEVQSQGVVVKLDDLVSMYQA